MKIILKAFLFLISFVLLTGLIGVIDTSVSKADDQGYVEITVDGYNIYQYGCFVCGSEYWSGYEENPYYSNQPPAVSFSDPVPTGTIVTKIEAVINGVACEWNYGEAVTTEVSVNGEVVGLAVQDGSQCYCGGCLPVTVTSDAYQEGFPGYVYGGMNALELEIINEGFIALDRVDLKIYFEDPNQPPDCSEAYADPGCIWPPNHKFVDVSIMGVTDPDGDDVQITITGITSDEPTGTGSGGSKHTPDANGIGTDTASIRAERSGDGDGRVYVIQFVASDNKGGECEGSVTVKVPHDQSKKNDCPAVDSGQNYPATLPN